MVAQLRLNLDYEQIIALIEQLSHDEQQKVALHILSHPADEHELTVEEKLHLLDSIKMNLKFNEEPSIRREDWYDDDGR